MGLVYGFYGSVAQPLVEGNLPGIGERVDLSPVMPASAAHFGRFHWIRQVEREFIASRFGLSKLERT
ncbi:MAG: hypothetical protein NTV86_10980, partial [Planctomycetota bacterium]|nr:hypothetical protein [Planctomycetota bacterium]